MKTPEGVCKVDAMTHDFRNGKCAIIGAYGPYFIRLYTSPHTDIGIHGTHDEIKVMRHPVNKEIYGVTLHQGYSSDTYSDDGYLFLLWDFRDEQHPQIHVRTWQPDAYDTGTGIKTRIPQDEIFSLSDFDIF